MGDKFFPGRAPRAAQLLSARGKKKKSDKLGIFTRITRSPAKSAAVKNPFDAVIKARALEDTVGSAGKKKSNIQKTQERAREARRAAVRQRGEIRGWGEAARARRGGEKKERG